MRIRDVTRSQSATARGHAISIHACIAEEPHFAARETLR